MPLTRLVAISSVRSSKPVGATCETTKSQPRWRAASPMPATSSSTKGSERRASRPCGRGTTIATVAAAVVGPAGM